MILNITLQFNWKTRSWNFKAVFLNGVLTVKRTIDTWESVQTHVTMKTFSLRVKIITLDIVSKTQSHAY